MNILVHSHMFPNPVLPINGIFVYDFCTYLSRAGHKVFVVSPVPFVPPFISRKSDWYRYHQVPRVLPLHKLEVFYPRFFSIPKLKFFFVRGDLMWASAFSFYERFLRRVKIDLIHAHVVLPDGVVASYLSKIHGIPFGVTIHGADLLKSIPRSRLNYYRIRHVLKQASFVGVVSHKLRSLLDQYNLTPCIKRLEVIYNGVNIPSLRANVQWRDNNPKAIRMLSVGRVIEQKGYKTVLQALPILKRRFPDLYYYIIGSGEDRDYFHDLAKSLGVDGFTFFLGALPREIALNYVRDCDLFVLPSKNEAFGIVYLEAMYFGKVVVGSRNEGIAEIIRHGVNGYLVDPDDVSDFVNVVHKILSRKTATAHIKANAKKTVLEKFTWEENVNRYVKLYKKALTTRTAI